MEIKRNEQGNFLCPYCGAELTWFDTYDEDDYSDNKTIRKMDYGCVTCGKEFAIDVTYQLNYLSHKAIEF